jgi:hypothetical protein
MRQKTKHELWMQRKRVFELHCDLVMRRDGYLDFHNQNDERWSRIHKAFIERIIAAPD